MPVTTRHASVDAMWDAYWSARGVKPAGPPAPSVWHFCDNRADADVCASLVLEGRKRATATCLWEFQGTGDPLPRVGDLHIVTDWQGVAQAVIEVESVEVLAFDDVTAAHAALEGEGDGSLEYWQQVHRAYYTRVLAGTGHDVSGNLPIVFETFRVVFAFDSASPQNSKSRASIPAP